MVSTSNSSVAQASKYSALPNAEGVLGQRGVGKGVVPSHSQSSDLIVLGAKICAYIRLQNINVI